MCINKRFIYNRYINQSLLVDCGHCPACLAKKGNILSSRIRDHSMVQLRDNGLTAWFVTLTYNNNSVPYISRQELMSAKGDYTSINVYRDSKYKRLFGSSWFVRAPRTIIETRVINKDSYDFKNLRDLHGRRGKIGVCLYSDVQLFFKRLRQYLSKITGENVRLSLFACTEYGETYQRPHIHTLIWCPSVKASDFKRAVIKAWPMCYKNRFERAIEPARDASKYLASYVNSESTCAPFLRREFKARHSASLYFGTDYKKHSLARIIDMANQCDFSLDEVDSIKGTSSLRHTSKRFICRYFPAYKGFSRLDDNEVFKCLACTCNNGVHEAGDLSVYRTFSSQLELSDDDIINFSRALNRGMKRTGLSHLQYALLYMHVWRSFRLSLIKFGMRCAETKGIPLNEQFDNVYEIAHGLISTPELSPDDVDVINPNDFEANKQSDAILRDYFFKRVKQSKESDFVLHHDIY